MVKLELGDIDWRAAEINVPGKGQCRDRLPLLTDVGEAVADYLRDRTRSQSHRVFLRATAPRTELAGPSTVSMVVAGALKRAGLQLPVKGAHVLRHSLATRLIRAGASMAEIGQVLRHRAANTTEIYAKVDFAGLRALAQPWPGAGAGR